jgi:uncharacterized membrane protein
MALGLGLLWLVAGIVIGLIGWLGEHGRLPRQHWAGIRLASTMRSDATWQAAHRAGGPIMLGAGVLVASMGLLLMVFRPADESVTVVSLFLAVGLLGAVLVAGVLGSRAARAVRED